MKKVTLHCSSAPIRNACRRWVLKGLAFSMLPLGLGAPALGAAQESFPAKPVTIILPQPPGGAADRLMRTIASGLEKRWNQPVAVVSRPGGGAVVGTLATARSKPDGYTIGLTSASLSINAALERDLPYDGMSDLDPLVRLGYYNVGLVADKDFPANNIEELIALAKEQPGKVLFGSNGAFTAAHVAGVMFNEMAEIQMRHVPYNGAAPMYTDILGGTLPMGFSVVSSAKPFIEKGDMKVLGVTSATRSDLFPDWPAIAETIPNYEALSWAGFALPAGVPTEVKEKLSADLMEVLATPEIGEAMRLMGFELSPQPISEFSEFVQLETEKYRALAKEIGASIK